MDYTSGIGRKLSLYLKTALSVEFVTIIHQREIVIRNEEMLISIAENCITKKLYTSEV